MLTVDALTDQALTRYALSFLKANLDPDETAMLLGHDMSTFNVVTDEMMGHVEERLDALLALYPDAAMRIDSKRP